MDDGSGQHDVAFPVRPVRGARRVVVAFQALLLIAVGEALVAGLLLSDGSSLSDRANRTGLIVAGVILLLVWGGIVATGRRREPRFAVVVSDSGVDLPSPLTARRTRIAWPDLVSVTEQRQGAITWVYRAPDRRGTIRRRRLVTGPRADTAGFFEALAGHAARDGNHVTVERPHTGTVS